ncbi:MAG: extracellular solute-binding protein [Acidobacteria bacterium]|nr:MAG: extracellular solute-binding protein [Acidobacteriota bacterium]REK00481.1 MAG: extracellular solute-binding protein [Acidobacteriota bacterium]
MSAARRLLAAAALMTAISCGDGRLPLVLYSPHGRDLLVEIERAWEQARPEVDLRFLDMGSQEVLDRIRSERANPQADVWFGGPKVLFSRAAKEGLLQPRRPSWAETVPASARDADGHWTAVYRTPTLIVFNREAVTAEEAPADWDDLLDPRWRDEVLIRDPLASGTMRTIFGHLIARADTPEAGFEWLRSLDAQTREYVHSPALLHEKLVRQEGLVTVWEMTDILGLIDRGAPIDYRFPSSGAPVIDDAVAIVAGARHAAEAAEFVDWLGSREALLLAAREAFRLPARTDLPASQLPSWAERVQAELRPAPVDWGRLEEEGADWMQVWDRSVRGRG